jgi:hypothetical protein
MEGRSGKLMVMAQQSRVGPRGSDRKNLSDRGEESLMAALDQEETTQQRHGQELVPEFYLSFPPEYREELMKHKTARAVAMNKLLLGHEKLLDSKRSENSAGGIQEEAENELGKKLEMMRISPERQLYTKIQRALFKIEYKLTNKKMDKETMQLLKDMSNKLDMLDQGIDDAETDEIDDRCKSLGKKTVAEEMADEAERFASYRRLWEYKQGKTCGLFTDISEQLTNPFSFCC